MKIMEIFIKISWKFDANVLININSHTGLAPKMWQAIN